MIDFIKKLWRGLFPSEEKIPVAWPPEAPIPFFRRQELSQAKVPAIPASPQQLAAMQAQPQPQALPEITTGRISIKTDSGIQFHAEGTFSITTDGATDPGPDNPPGPIDPPIDPPTTGVYGIGVNTHPWVPLSKLLMFDTLRVYIDAAWLWRPNGIFVQPMWQAETAEASGIDVFLQNAKTLNKDVILCINRTPQWFRPESGSGTSNEYPPIKKGLLRTDPKSYAEYAEFFFQIVARYGYVQHPDSALKVDTTPRWPGDIPNQKKSGMGLIKRIEIGNEWDCWWNVGTEKYMTAKEHAAMLMAVMAAVKRADPTVEVIPAGLTGFDMKYIREMDAAFKAAGVKWPPYVNVHHYSNTRNRKGEWPPTWVNSGATYPETDPDFETIHEVVAFAKSVGAKVLVTEFGADTEAPSWMHISGAAHGGITDLVAQAELIVRSFKAYRAAGVDAVYQFMAADEPYGPGLWQRSGLMTKRVEGKPDESYLPKPSFNALAAYIKELQTGKLV